MYYCLVRFEAYSFGAFIEFMGVCCLQVYWPLDADWYSGQIVEYSPDSDQHHVCSLFNQSFLYSFLS